MIINIKAKYRTYTLANGQTINIPYEYVYKSKEYKCIKDFDKKEVYNIYIDWNIFNLSVVFEFKKKHCFNGACKRRNIDPSKEQCLDEFIYTNYMYDCYFHPYMAFNEQIQYTEYSKTYLYKYIYDLLGIDIFKYHKRFDTDLGLDGKDIQMYNYFEFYNECNKLVMKLEDKRRKRCNKKQKQLINIVMGNNERLKNRNEVKL
jgi:hypothetical protein